MSHSYSLKGLYAITDGSVGDELFAKVEQALQGGISILQYRDKSTDKDKRLAEAKTLCAYCHQYNVPLIINDDVQLAIASHADGVHLGSEDGSFLDARNLLGPESIIGVSCYNDIALAKKAEVIGADYVAFGSFFPSLTKPSAPQATIQTLRDAKAQLKSPICCIGGITLENAPLLIQEKPDMLAVISTIFASDNIAKSSNTFKQLFNS
ncbi:MAG: Thiamin-phosphate pyrophosphorylase (EC [uncultured Thiotrichaceae bacterium]|uniref:Thiamine-phosphate synthase n=1 Tax=uncultured Thiotrichaceae bacterium TaxID=298394 RepID=A0A6S6SFE2_9GAMM|nr:MAG: Thiamin-phosphate pyrophosphorylase (EC [uncultured Thiotrichaceae bacterium]